MHTHVHAYIQEWRMRVQSGESVCIDTNRHCFTVDAKHITLTQWVPSGTLCQLYKSQTSAACSAGLELWVACLLCASRTQSYEAGTWAKVGVPGQVVGGLAGVLAQEGGGFAHQHACSSTV